MSDNYGDKLAKRGNHVYKNATKRSKPVDVPNVFLLSIDEVVESVKQRELKPKPVRKRNIRARLKW